MYAIAVLAIVAIPRHIDLIAPHADPCRCAAPGPSVPALALIASSAPAAALAALACRVSSLDLSSILA